MNQKERDAADTKFTAAIRGAFKEWYEHEKTLWGDKEFSFPGEHRLYCFMRQAIWKLIEDEAMQNAACARIVEQRLMEWKDRMKKRLTNSRKFRSQLIEKVASIVVQEWED